MRYIFMGLVSAMLFGIGTVAVYGAEALMENAWTEYVFWWLIAISIGLAFLDETTGLRCRICKRISGTLGWCQHAPCH